MDILESIMGERRDAVAEAKRSVSFQSLAESAADRTHHSLVAKLETESGSCVIAEMKKASPSAGMLRSEYNPAEMAVCYEQAGACAVSVLTEPLHFLGDAEHLRVARSVVKLPILRKDFMCDVYQVAEAAAWGADVILLIVAALDLDLMRDLYDAAMGFGLNVLAEAHTAEEIDIALGLEKAIIGVNSRNLKTLKTNLDVARSLADRIPANRLSVAESGISKRKEIMDLENRGYKGFLIGEALVGENDPAGRLREFLGIQAEQ